MKRTAYDDAFDAMRRVGSAAEKLALLAVAWGRDHDTEVTADMVATLCSWSPQNARAMLDRPRVREFIEPLDVNGVRAYRWKRG